MGGEAAAKKFEDQVDNAFKQVAEIKVQHLHCFEQLTSHPTNDARLVNLGVRVIEVSPINAWHHWIQWVVRLVLVRLSPYWNLAVTAFGQLGAPVLSIDYPVLCKGYLGVCLRADVVGYSLLSAVVRSVNVVA